MLPVLLLSCASGMFLAASLTPRLASGPRWTSLLYTAGLGVLFGPGLASILYFGLVIAHAATPRATYGALAALLTASVVTWSKFRETGANPAESSHKFPWVWLLGAALAAGVVLLALDMQAATEANPHGEWDASAIWNLRARYLAAGHDTPETWKRAISPSLGGGMIGASHPGYPLFLSAFVAMQWTVSGGFELAAPIATGALIPAAILALLVASLAARRSLSLGLLAGLLLVATELFASQASSQYADLLEGLAVLAALFLLDVSRDSDGAVAARLLTAAGLAIGLAPWIKNEGQPFAIAALAVAVWRFRGGAVWTLIGAIPGFAATAAVKLLSDGRETMFPSTAGEIVSKLADVSRWWQALLGFGKAFLDAGGQGAAGVPWAHPLLLAVVLGVTLQMIPSADRRARWWLAIPMAVLLAAEYGLYLITNADLDWHISTSVERLLAQVWPALLYLFFSLLRAPEDYFEPPEPVLVGVPSGGPTPKGKKRRSSAASELR